MAHSTQYIAVSDNVERQMIIDDACSKYVEIGFLPDMFTTRRIHEYGYNDQEFLELIKSLYSMEDQKELKLLTASIPKNDLGKFLELMEWLKTEEGRKTISDAFMRISTRNTVVTEEVVALAQKLVGYAVAQRLTRENILGEINKLMRRLRELEKESSDIEEDLKITLGPLYEYKEPSLRELRIEAYKLYEDDCKTKRIPAFPINHEKGFEIATREFGDVAKNLHLRKYLNDPVRKETIEKHFKKKSYKFVAGDDKKGGGGSDEIFEFAADSGEANKALALADVYKPQPLAVDSPSSGETDESYVPNTGDSVEPVVNETPEKLVKPASDLSKAPSPDSKRAQIKEDVSDESQSKRKRAHTDMTEGVSNEPQDSEKPTQTKKKK
ncbi:hypothetical protein TSUD_262300 [Trifolium subterraneum]|nr:hypothetical protein TSUD_262300 [Trifolium subterraneum]